MSKHNSFQKENCQFSHWLHLQLLFKAYIQNEMSSSRSSYPIIVSSEPPQAVLITCAPLRPVASSVVTSSYLPPINPTYLPTLFMEQRQIQNGKWRIAVWRKIFFPQNLNNMNWLVKKCQRQKISIQNAIITHNI